MIFDVHLIGYVYINTMLHTIVNAIYETIYIDASVSLQDVCCLLRRKCLIVLYVDNFIVPNVITTL